MSAIGENIRSIRREQKLTQLALAMRVGVTPQAVGKWERGESEPDISLLLPIAKALNVTAETLFGLENRRGSAPASFLAEEFPESLKCRRLAANLTQAELARKLDVRPQTVSKWETGVCAPDIGYCRALCGLYGITPAALLSERALPPQRAQAPAVPAAPAPAAAECVKKPGFFSKRPVRAAALALFLVLALCIVLVPFSLGSSSPSLPGSSAQQPEDPAPPGGGTEEPENPGGGTEEPEEPENPGELPPPEITYYTLTAQQAELALCRELDTAYTFLEGYIRFYEEFCALHARYPQMPRSELFLYLNDPSREPVFPSTVRAEADGVPLTLPMGHIPGGANFPYLSVREALPEKAERFEAFCAEAILQPTLQLAYALTQESVPLEAAVSALKNFGAFVSVGNEAVTKTYRAFVAGHAGAAEYDFPAFTDFMFV